MFDGRFRSSVDKGVSPIGSALGRTGLSPDHLTALGLILSVPAAVAIGSGRLGLGLVLLIASAVPDLLDGALAKASGTASVRGAFFDSVSDRVTDAFILGGLAWYLGSSKHSHLAVLPFAILAVSTLISYQRAKAESLGFTAKGGLMERAERVILLCIGLVASVILVPILWVMLILTSVTAVQRFLKVWRQATVAGLAGAAGGAAGAAGAGGAVQAGGGDAALGSSGSAEGARAGALGSPPASVWRSWRHPDGDHHEERAARNQDRRVGRTPVATSGRAGGSRQGEREPWSTRWEQRRAARFAVNADDPRVGGRRHSTRRP